MRVRSTYPLRDPFALLALTLTLGFVVPPQLRAGQAPIPWRTDFERAQTEARSLQKPIWIQLTGPWCFYCRRMDRETLDRPEVVALSRIDFIPVKIRADEREDLVQRFGISGLPATVILTSGGQLVDRREGFMDVNELLGFLFASRPPLSNHPSGEPDRESIALAGYDVVRLVSGHGLAEGITDYSVDYDGQVFRFVNDDDRKAFLKNPEKFLPCNQGRCVVNLVDRGACRPGDPRYGVYYRGRLYLCADAEARQRFAADPARYADADLGDAGHCPHCRTLAGRLVPGSPQFSIIHQGRRYLFPDALHLEAFRAAPDRFLR